jgi:hypothetical protein
MVRTNVLMSVCENREMRFSKSFCVGFCVWGAKGITMGINETGCALERLVANKFPLG